MGGGDGHRRNKRERAIGRGGEPGDLAQPPAASGVETSPSIVLFVSGLSKSPQRAYVILGYEGAKPWRRARSHTRRARERLVLTTGGGGKRHGVCGSVFIARSHPPTKKLHFHWWISLLIFFSLPPGRPFVIRAIRFLSDGIYVSRNEIRDKLEESPRAAPWLRFKLINV